VGVYILSHYCHQLRTKSTDSTPYALYLGGEVFTRIFDEDKLQQGAAPAGPERIIHTVKAAFRADKENTAMLVSDISNAYNERSRAKMLSTLYSRPELRHL
jgi:hypothetical protein